MAISIRSVGTQSFIPVTDVGSTGTFLVTKMTGLTSGDMMLVEASVDRVSANIGVPAGWAFEALPNGDNTISIMAWKTADASDVSGSGFTFTTTTDTCEIAWVSYALTGTRTTATPFIVKDGDSFINSDGVVKTGTVSLYAPSGSLILLSFSTSMSSNQVTFSTYGITGATASFTERQDSSDPDGGITAIADAITSTEGTITAYTVTTSNAVTGDTVYGNIFVIYPQSNANGTVAFTTSNQTAFEPTGQAGANGIPTFTTSTPTALEPTGRGTSPTQWNNESIATTTWTNEASL